MPCIITQRTKVKNKREERKRRTKTPFGKGSVFFLNLISLKAKRREYEKGSHKTAKVGAENYP